MLSSVTVLFLVWREIIFYFTLSPLTPEFSFSLISCFWGNVFCLLRSWNLTEEVLTVSRTGTVDLKEAVKDFLFISDIIKGFCFHVNNPNPILIFNSYENCTFCTLYKKSTAFRWKLFILDLWNKSLVTALTSCFSIVCTGPEISQLRLRNSGMLNGGVFHWEHAWNMFW